MNQRQMAGGLTAVGVVNVIIGVYVYIAFTEAP